MHANSVSERELSRSNQTYCTARLTATAKFTYPSRMTSTAEYRSRPWLRLPPSWVATLRSPAAHPRLLGRRTPRMGGPAPIAVTHLDEAGYPIYMNWEHIQFRLPTIEREASLSRCSPVHCLSTSRGWLVHLQSILISSIYHVKSMLCTWYHSCSWVCSCMFMHVHAC